MKYDFSFIVPVYNAEKYLRRTVKSILDQDYDTNKIEIILINDGSTDNSLKICNSFKRDNIVVLDQKNGGVSNARNNGLKHARGKIITFLDSDDFISNNLCKEVYKMFHENDIDVVTYPLVNYNRYKTKMHFRYASLYEDKDKVYDINKYPEIIQTTINISFINRFNENELFNEKIIRGEDEDYATRCIMHKRKIGYLPDVKYYYRKNNNSSATKTYKVTEKEFNTYTNYYLDLLKKYKNVLYIKNMFLNTLRWRIDENKLVPSNDKKYFIKLEKLLSYINIEDILSLSFLSISLRLAVLELKKVKYTILYEDKIYIKIANKKYDINKEVEYTIRNVKKKPKGYLITGLTDLPIDCSKIKYKDNKKYDYFDTPIYNFSYESKNNVFDITDIKYKIKIVQRIRVKELFYEINIDNKKAKINRKGILFTSKKAFKILIRK